MLAVQREQSYSARRTTLSASPAEMRSLFYGYARQTAADILDANWPREASGAADAQKLLAKLRQFFPELRVAACSLC